MSSPTQITKMKMQTPDFFEKPRTSQTLHENYFKSSHESENTTTDTKLFMCVGIYIYFWIYGVKKWFVLFNILLY